MLKNRHLPNTGCKLYKASNAWCAGGCWFTLACLVSPSFHCREPKTRIVGVLLYTMVLTKLLCIRFIHQWNSFMVNVIAIFANYMFKKLCAKNSNVSNTFVKVHMFRKLLCKKLFLFSSPNKITTTNLEPMEANSIHPYSRFCLLYQS
jgi:hypothetical protein